MFYDSLTTGQNAGVLSRCDSEGRRSLMVAQQCTCRLDFDAISLFCALVNIEADLTGHQRKVANNTVIQRTQFYL